MKSASKLSLGFVTGFLTCALLGGTAAFAASGIFAEKSTCQVFVNGQETTMEAYVIQGRNYLKLRDVGQLVGFNVWWDGSVQIDSTAPYTGEAPVAEKNQVVTNVYFSDHANSGIFSEVCTREAYDALRQCVLTGESGPVAVSQETRAAMEKVSAALGTFPNYDLTVASDGRVRLTARYPNSYQEAAAVCGDFIAGLEGKSDRDKLFAFGCLVSDHLEYRSSTSTSPATLFTREETQYGNCMSYARGFKFLCDLAKIPCVYVHGPDYQWCQVYAEGQWQDVDLTSFDLTRSSGWDPHIFLSGDSLQNASFRQTEPWLTEFAKEVLIPGSTNS